MADWPEGVTEAKVVASIDGILRREDWDQLSVKVVLKKLEAELVASGADGSLRAHKKFVKTAVDDAMARILAEGSEPGGGGAAGAPKPTQLETPADIPEPPAEAEAEEEAAPAPAPPEAAPEVDSAPGSAPAPEAVPGADVDADDAPARKKRRVDEDEDESAAAAEGEEDEDEEEEDEDAAVVVGKPTRKADGKLFYTQMKKRNEAYSIGQDVYLENGREAPYVARLQEIFAYAFAPTELYFNARWYYRKDDVHDYAKLAGASGFVKFEGGVLTASPKELFFSLHLDENHSDCILRPCNVHLCEDRAKAPQLEDSLLSQHEYFAWRAYDNKVVYALDSLPNKKLRDALALEAKRGPAVAQAARDRARMDRERDRARREDDEAEKAPLSNDELRALVMPRKHAEVWVDTPVLSKVAVGSLARVAQRLNNVKSFYVGIIVSTKRALRPYRLGKKQVDISLQLRTSVGMRLAGLDALSNEPPTDLELERFRVPLAPAEVRRKLREIQARMSEHSDMFDSAEVARKAEEEERLRLAREAQWASDRQAEEERERREREREELRRRQADKTAGGGDSEQWWLQYNVTLGDSSGREVAKWKARLSRFTKIANSSVSAGERDNATRLADQARLKIEQLESGADKLQASQNTSDDAKGASPAEGDDQAEQMEE